MLQQIENAEVHDVPRFSMAVIILRPYYRPRRMSPRRGLDQGAATKVKNFRNVKLNPGLLQPFEVREITAHERRRSQRIGLPASTPRALVRASQQPGTFHAQAHDQAREIQSGARENRAVQGIADYQQNKYRRWTIYSGSGKMVARGGIEPPTRGFSVRDP